MKFISSLLILCVILSANTWAQGYTRDFLIEVSKGNVPGHTIMNKFGENPDIDNGDFEAIWDAGGLYVAPTQARLHNLISTLAADAGTVLSSGTATGGSATTIIDTEATFETDTVAVGDIVLNDSNVNIGVVTAVNSEFTLTFSAGMRSPNNGFGVNDGGPNSDKAEPNASGDSYRVVTDASTGASVIHILGLDASFLRQEEFVVLNGASNVATANTYTRQERARVFATASTDAAGTITSTAQTDGTVTLQVVNGNNQTLMAVYTIPANQTGYLLDWWARLSKKVSALGDLSLKGGRLGGIQYVVQKGTVSSLGSSAIHHNFSLAPPIPGGTSLVLYSGSDSTDAGFSGGFSILLVEDEF